MARRGMHPDQYIGRHALGITFAIAVTRVLDVPARLESVNQRGGSLYCGCAAQYVSSISGLWGRVLQSNTGQKKLPSVSTRLTGGTSQLLRASEAGA